jgi:cell division protein FtsN
MRAQRGGLVLGLIIGLLVGLGVALALALYVTKAPVPFVNKVPPRTSDQDAAEAERNRNWDPNAGLAGKPPPKAIESATSASGAASAPPMASGTPPKPITVPSASGRDPAAILAGAPVTVPAVSPSGSPSTSTTTSTPVAPAAAASRAPAASAAAARSAKPGSDPFVYFVQAGAYQSSTDAEQQRAKLAMLGVEARVIEREQSGRTVFRVRAGPFAKQAEADGVKEKLGTAGVEAMMVRVEASAASPTSPPAALVAPRPASAP